MSKAKWSPEPWKLHAELLDGESFNWVEDAEDLSVSEIRSERVSRVDRANARRIVACVNACQGIPTEALESGALGRALDSVEQALRFANEDIDNRYTMKGSTVGAVLQACSALRALGRLK